MSTKVSRRRLWRLTEGWVLSALVLAGCSSPATPTPPPPIPDPDPPQITCPAPQTVRSLNGSATPVVYGSATAVHGKPPVTTVCEPAAGSQFPVGQTTVKCTATDTLQRIDTCTFLVTVTAPPLLSVSPQSFLAFGDSITAGEDGVSSLTAPSSSSRLYQRVFYPPPQTYPGALRDSMVARYTTQSPTMANRGQPGEALTDTDHSTFARFTSLTSSGQYKVVLIMEGTNDLADRDARQIPPAIEVLRQMIRDAKSRGIRPYIATIPPMNPAGSRGLAWSLVPDFNDRVRALAAAESTTLVDVHQGFANNFGLLGVDGLHPNAAGYAKIADVFFTAIQATLETAPAAPTLAGPAVWPSFYPRFP